MSAVLSLVPPLPVAPSPPNAPARTKRTHFQGHTKAGRRQVHEAPYEMKPAVNAALYAKRQIASVDYTGMTAVFVHEPNSATLMALVGVLGFLQLVIVFAMTRGWGPPSRVFAVRAAVFGTKLDAVRARHPNQAQAPCFVFSGASSVPLIVRCPALPRPKAPPS